MPVHKKKMSMRYSMLPTFALLAMISMVQGGEVLAQGTVPPPPQVLAPSEDPVIIPGSQDAVSPDVAEIPADPVSAAEVSQIPSPPQDIVAEPVVPIPEQVTAPVVTEVTGDVQPPPLMPIPDEAVQAAPDVTPEIPQASSGAIKVDTIPDAGKSDGPEAYYDSTLNVPTGPLGDTVGPRKVDPVQEPASKLVITRRNRDAVDQESQLIAANRALELGRHEAAYEMFDALSKKNPRDARILMGLAISQQKMGLDDLAIVNYEKVLDIAPANADAAVNMMGLIQKRYPEVALRQLKDLYEKHPANPGIVAQLAMTNATLGQVEEAVRFFGMAASMEPNNPQHIYNLAVLTDKSGNKSQAIGYYEEALKLDAVYGDGRSIPRERVYDRLSQLRQD